MLAAVTWFVRLAGNGYSSVALASFGQQCAPSAKRLGPLR